MAILASFLVGCANSPTKGSIPWWPQGPGNADELEVEKSDINAEGKKSDDLRNETRSLEAESRSPGSGVVDESAAPMNTLAVNPVAGTGALHIPPYSRYGNLYFLSALTALNTKPATLEAGPLGIKREAQLIMESVKATLAAEGLTMTNIVSVTLYLIDLGDLPEVDTVFGSYFPSVLPARTVVAAQRLPGDARVQVAIIAGR